MSTAALGNLVRIAPLELSDLPPHPSIPQDVEESPFLSTDLRLRTFILAILEEASAFLSPSIFSNKFTLLSTKTSPPSTAPVDLYKQEISSSEISSIKWSENQKVPRRAPAQFQDETWFARRSLHKNESSKTQEGSASWPEFVFGLKEQHSKHEQDFSPMIYDAHHILDWNEEIRKLLQNNTDIEVGIQGDNGTRYTDITMEIFEMCHTFPTPLSPRCFPILVLTASTTPTSFLAVTVPVHLPPTLPTAYYSSGRNTTDPSAASAQHRKTTVFGVYVAVETVRSLGGAEGGSDGDGSGSGRIEWTMATAGDAKGHLPMFLQKSNVPAAVAKDVGFFMKWIPTVDVEAEGAEG